MLALDTGLSIYIYFSQSRFFPSSVPVKTSFPVLLISPSGVMRPYRVNLTKVSKWEPCRMLGQELLTLQCRCKFLLLLHIIKFIQLAAM